MSLFDRQYHIFGAKTPAQTPSPPVEDEALVLPELPAEVLSASRQLLRATTIREIYETPFPLSLAWLTRPLTAFASEQNKDGILAILDMQGNIKLCESLKKKNKARSPDQLKPFREVIAINTLHNHAIADGRTWQTSAFAYVSFMLHHGDFVHFDYPETLPNGFTALAVNANGSRVLPHQETLRILEHSRFAHVLNIRLDDPDLRSKMEEFYNDVVHDEDSWSIRAEMREAMITQSPGRLNLLTGMDFHEQGEVDYGRVCIKLTNNFAIHNNWQRPRL